MDFTFNEAERAVVDLTEQILSDRVDHQSLKQLEADGAAIDQQTWQSLIDAGVVAALLPEADGGAGLGAVALAGVLAVVGEHAALVPMLTTVAMGAVPIAAFGTAEQRSVWLPGILDGSTLATAAIDLDSGTVEARADGAGWILAGDRSFVPLGLDADLLLVDTGDSGVFVVPADASGLSTDRLVTTTGHTEARLRFDAVLVGPDAGLGPIGDWMRARADIGLCALMAGICRGAQSLMAAYTQERQQFDRTIASFQAVSQRAGDIYIDTEAVQLTTYSAAWRIDSGLPADDQIAIARWWAAEAGDRVTRGATHLHGGVGVDRDYPLHRHYLAARQLELTLGNAEQQLARLGASLA